MLIKYQPLLRQAACSTCIGEFTLYKKLHRRGVVAPAPVTTTASTGGPTSNVSKTISNRGPVPPNRFRRVSSTGSFVFCSSLLLTHSLLCTLTECVLLSQ